MKLKELLEVCQYTPIHLHSGRDGKLIAKTSKTLAEYGEVAVSAMYAKIECGRDGDFARPYLYVFGSSYDIDSIRKKQGGA